MTDYNNYSEPLWLQDSAYEDWRRFMGHDHLNPSRYLGYHLIAEYVWKKENKSTLAEIGFGDLCDFRFCFKWMHDRGAIEYRGYEIMPQFVRHASDDYWDYSWKVGGFLDLEPDSYDLTYTRHTLEHVHPMLWRRCLVRMLRATKRACVLTWYMPPAETRLMAKNWVGDGWQNAYYEGDVERIVEALGFNAEIWSVAGGDEIWCLERVE